MIFLATVGILFLILVGVSSTIRIHYAKKMIEGAEYELERAREERAAMDRQQFPINPNGYRSHGYDNYGVSRR